MPFLDTLPDSLTGDAQVQGLAAAVTAQLQALPALIATVAVLPNVATDAEAVLDALARQLHVDNYYQDDAIATKRALVLEGVRMHRLAGTPAALAAQLDIYLGAGEWTLTEWFEMEPADPHHTFTLAITANPSGAAWRRLYDMIRAVKRASAHMVMTRTADYPLNQNHGLATTRGIIRSSTAV
jgi:phage tail P2-like protein